MKPTTYTDITQTIRDAGLAGSIVCVHSSLGSFGYVERGTDAVIQAFLDSGCTLAVPTFTYECESPAPPGRQIPQNGYDYSEPTDPGCMVPYDGDSPMISQEMGAIPARLVEMPERVRGDHPINSFSAVGPEAREIIETQSLLNVYGPLKAMYAHRRASLILMGVDLTTATAIHLAEEKAGRRLFRRWSQGPGAMLEVQVGSCSDGFNNFSPHVKEIQVTAQAGKSTWRIFPFRPFIDIATRTIIQNPSLTHCPNQNCLRCNDAIRGGPIL